MYLRDEGWVWFGGLVNKESIQKRSDQAETGGTTQSLPVHNGKATTVGSGVGFAEVGVAGVERLH